MSSLRDLFFCFHLYQNIAPTELKDFSKKEVRCELDFITFQCRRHGISEEQCRKIYQSPGGATFLINSF